MKSSIFASGTRRKKKQSDEYDGDGDVDVGAEDPNRQELSEADRAYAAVAATLESWTSPRFSSFSEGGFQNSPPPRWHSPDPVEWIREEVENVDSMEDEDEEDNEDEEEVVENPFSQLLHNKRGHFRATPRMIQQQREAVDDAPPSQQQRASTPVMSNESKKRQHQQLGGTSDSLMMAGLMTPNRILHAPFGTPFSSSSMSMMTAPPSVVASAASTYKRYHDALQSFWWKRREALAVDGVSFDSSTTTRIDIEFLRSLHRIGWDMPVYASSSPSQQQQQQSFTRFQREGNFWLLLAYLRTLSPDAILWEETSQAQMETQRFLDALSRFSVNKKEPATPRDVLARLHAPIRQDENDALTPPLLLKRRKTILQWLETCFGHLVPSRSAWPVRGEIVYNNSKEKSSASLFLPTTTKDKALFETALSLVLAGRLPDAQALARDLGTPWRAAMWGGESPHGYIPAQPTDSTSSVALDTKSSTLVSVGNPQRPLWRRMMWMQSEHLNQNATSGHPEQQQQGLAAAGTFCCPEEGALAAIFACHVKDAVSNAALRTWEKGLYVTLRSVWGRMEDEILHRHNMINHNVITNNSSHNGSSTHHCYAKQEREHLQATVDIAELNELRIVETLTASPFPEMTGGDDICTEAAASFVVGQVTIINFLNRCMEYLERTTDEQALRFLTHLIIYLSSLSGACNSMPQDMEELLEEWKNQLLIGYLEHLGSRDDLWSLLVLYAALLPEQPLVEYLPSLLCDIEAPDDREVVVAQLGQCLPPGLDVIILRRVVQLVLNIGLEDQGARGVAAHHRENNTSATPTRLDVRKMKSILWLFLNPAHRESAFVFANKLLRMFLLQEKVPCAFMFIEDILPTAASSIEEDFMVIEEHAGVSDSHMERPDELIDAGMESAHSEIEAIRSYLTALKAVDHFHDVLETSDTQPGLVDDEIDKSLLDSTQVTIANGMERRQLLQEKRKCRLGVVVAANEAVNSMLAVLEHPGGWLLAEDEEEIHGSASAAVRKVELETLRRMILPNVVLTFNQVCLDTASWMATSLEDAMSRLNYSQASALAALDSEENSPLMPSFWTAKASKVAWHVASDRFNIKTSMTPQTMKELLSKLADTTVRHLKYTTKKRTD